MCKWPWKYDFDDLKVNPVKITATISCASNRSKEMDYQKQIRGPVIGPGGIGTAVWTGIRLCDVLWQVSPFDKPGLHVEFFGADKTDANGALY